MFKDIVLELCPTAIFRDVEIVKNNVVRKGVQVDVGTSVNPVFYDVENISREAIEEAINNASDIAKEVLGEDVDISAYAVKIEGNEEFLKDCKYDTVCDLAVVKRGIVDGGKGISSFVVKDEREVNIPYMLTSIADIVDIIDVYDTTEEFMYYISNKHKMFGSGAIGDTEYLKKVHKKVGDFYILPSSIHELLVVPKKNNIKPDDLRAMVVDVNKTLEPEIILSDNVYYFDGNEVTIA